jgi:hypothetical protein
VKGARKYSRATKVQVPLLILLVGLLSFLIADQFLPECSKPWGDCNPAYVQIEEQKFVAFNRDSVSIWSVDHDCPIDASCENCMKVSDIDGDGISEVLYVSTTSMNLPCSKRNLLAAYSRAGHLRFRVPIVKLHEYPGDSTIDFPYYVQDFENFSDDKGCLFMTQATASYPARMHIRFWSKSGDSIGWYINQGFGGGGQSSFAVLSQDTVAFLVYNNRLKQTVLLVLKAFGSEGVSPPYNSHELPVPNVRRGNQLAYIALPSVRLNWKSEVLTSNPARLIQTGYSALRADVFQLKTGSEWKAFLTFNFDNDFRINSVTASDGYLVERDSLVRAGILSAGDALTQHPSLLLDSVNYWTDSGFVTEAALRAAGQ